MSILRRFREKTDVPPDIYVSLVNSLYSEGRALFLGAICASAAAFLSAWKADDIWILFAAVGLAVVGVVRAIDMRAFQRHRRDNSSMLKAVHAAARWEQRYVLGAAAHIALLGAWCFLAFARTSDPFVQLLSFSVTLGYMVGISGRNFGNNGLVTTQIVFAAVPMIGGLMITGDPYYFFLAALLAPFFLGLKFISLRLHKTLLDAVVSTREMSLLANRFDTALNNMSHGLCMVDAEQRIVVCNRRMADLFGIVSEAEQLGRTVRELLEECVDAGTIARAELDRLIVEFEHRLAINRREKLMMETRSGRSLDLTFEPMENGGSVVLVEDITERRFAEAKIRHLARYDVVTGLPNRAYFREEMDKRLTEAHGNGDLCAVLFIDLDEFKQVNDTLGHPCGDRLLCAVSDRLRTIVRQSDLLARFGGDEFIILQSPVKQITDTGILAERIVKLLSQPYEVDGHEVVIGASIGIAMTQNDGIDADRLLKNADMALYRAKSGGRGGWCFFEPEMDVQAQARRAMELDLRNALANNSFEVFYQPLLNLKTKRISTCEALLRWPHPVRGMVPPGEFIPVAEEMGLIVEIGEMVLRRVCHECMTWPNDVRVAVNMSSIQFRRGNVTRIVREALAESGLSADRLEIEITESVLLQDTQATRATLAELRELGVRISLDDFGTGYSSLSYLQSFPLDKVKIDRSFVQGVTNDDRSLVLLHGVARLSAELGLSVVVEGIETEDQLDLVTREPSIGEAQGFLFSAAVPGGQIHELLSAVYGEGRKRRLADDKKGEWPVPEAMGW